MTDKRTLMEKIYPFSCPNKWLEAKREEHRTKTLSIADDPVLNPKTSPPLVILGQGDYKTIITEDDLK